MKKIDDWKMKELEHHKKNEQRGKVRTIGLPLLEALKRWPYVKLTQPQILQETQRWVLEWNNEKRRKLKHSL